MRQQHRVEIDLDAFSVEYGGDDDDYYLDDDTNSVAVMGKEVSQVIIPEDKSVSWGPNPSTLMRWGDNCVGLPCGFAGI